MTVVLFVHGTGSREPAYGANLSRIRAGLVRSSAPADVRPCYWGGSCGSWLRAGGLSLPGRDTARGSNGTFPADEEVALWGLLERDPLLELRLSATDTTQELHPGAPIPGRDIASAAQALTADEELLGALAAAGLVEAFCDAVPVVMTSEPGQLALAMASALDGDLRMSLARAFVAQALMIADERIADTVPVDGGQRDHILTIVVDRLLASHRGIGGALARSGLRLALSLGATKPLERRREATTRSATPFAGDVMTYLARGEPIRDYIESAVRDVDGPVVLLAHSLGGIASVDLLVNKSVSNVVGLVTVGCQASYLYELNALPSLPFGQKVPEHFPRRWVNVFDRRDLLSYTTAGMFGEWVVDIAIDNRSPFPRSHSAYFGNAGFYDLLAGFLATVST